MVSKLKSTCQRKKLIKYQYVWRIVLGITLIIITIISVLTDPVVMLTRFCVKISNHSFITYKMQQSIKSAEYTCYLFNVTNAHEFMSGVDAKLKLDEIGPFTYHETRTNVDLEVDTESNTLKYTPVSKLHFVPEKSVGYPNETFIYIPNSIFLALASYLSHGPTFLQSLFNFLNAPLNTKSILRKTAENLLMGYDDHLVTIGQKVLPGIVVFKKFGILSHAFGLENRIRYEVNTTDDNKFEIISVNGSRGIVNLDYNTNKKYCNTFTAAYEGMLFPTFLSPNRNIRIYHKLICRMMDLQYIGNDTTEDGFETYKYSTNNNSYNYDNGQNECSCASRKCLKGTSEISPCLGGLPVLMSNPHFLNADEKIFNKLEGLRPDFVKHASNFQIHQKVGVTIKAQMALQLNIGVGDVGFNAEARPFSNMMVPIAWARAEVLPLPMDIAILLKILSNWLPTVVLITEIVTTLLGIYLILSSIFQWYIAREQSIVNILTTVEANKMPLMINDI